MLLSANRDPAEIDDRLRDAHAMTAGLMSDVIAETCRRYPPIMRTTKSQRIERLIQSGAWMDVTLALIELELPQWQVRRIAYDEGEWHCALSRQRELPEWLDQAVEASHRDLALAILAAFVDALQRTAGETRIGRPSVPQIHTDTYAPFLCENFA